MAPTDNHVPRKPDWHSVLIAHAAGLARRRYLPSEEDHPRWLDEYRRCDNAMGVASQMVKDAADAAVADLRAAEAEIKRLTTVVAAVRTEERAAGRAEAVEHSAWMCEQPRCRTWSPEECAGQIRRRVLVDLERQDASSTTGAHVGAAKETP